MQDKEKEEYSNDASFQQKKNDTAAMILPKEDTEKEIDTDLFLVDTSETLEEDLFADLNASLMQQVAEELEAEKAAGTTDEKGMGTEMDKKGKKKKVLLIIGSVFLVLILLLAFLVGTPVGRKAIYWVAGQFIHGSMNSGTEDEDYFTDITPAPPSGNEDEPGVTAMPIPVDHTVRSEEYVKNFLLFGIEQIDGASNTDTMMIASINTNDKTVKLTSILRDMYVDLGDGIGRKLNSVYARGRRDGQGPELLMATIEKYYKIDLEGYAYVNFDSFEKIVDRLGGVTIELGQTEVNYLNTTNYISNPAYRNLRAGLFKMNGNQVVGYCRVRKVVTLGGANNDYGRTVRQRRVLEAIFNEYKSKNIFELLSITTDCLAYITTDLSASQISELLEMIVENGITSMESSRIPINDSFYDSGRSGYNGVTYGLVVNDPAANIKYLFQYLYNDTEEEAEANYNALD